MADTVREFLVAQVERKLNEAKSITENAEGQNRELSPDEKQEIERKLDDVTKMKADIKAIDDRQSLQDTIAEMRGPIVTTSEEVTDAKTIGEAFVKSDGYQHIKATGFGGAWSTGQVELPDYFAGKTLMDETASAGALYPTLQPGIRLLPQTRLVVSDLMPNLQLDGPSLKYFVETTATNAADAVLEGGTKQESTLVLDDKDEPLRKIATVLTITDELLEDVTGIRGYIDSRGTYFVQAKEEAEIVSGNGTAPHLAGFLDDSRDLPTGSALSLDADSALDAILMAITKIRVDGEAEPDGIVINPYDYHALRTLKDANRQYFAGGPFTGAYGNGAIPGGNGPGPDIWLQNTVITPAISQGTVLIGAFATHSALFRKGGLTVEASNSHANNFVENKTTIRFEERVALAVYRKQAFYVITALSGLIS